MTSKSLRALLPLLLLGPIACVAQERDAAAAAATITETDVLRRIGVIAHDSMGGRETPSPGLEATAEWAAAELRRFGLRGGAPDGAFIQRYPLRAVLVDTHASTLSSGAVTLRYGSDVAPVRGGAGSAEVAAELAVVSGSGQLSRAAAEDVAGRHAVVVLGADQVTLDRNAFGLMASLANARAASVWIVTSASDAQWDAALRDVFQPAVSTGWGEEERAESVAPPVIRVRLEAAERILAGRGPALSSLRGRARRGIRVDVARGVRATLHHVVRTDSISAPNVVAVLPGSDPRLAAEHVVFSAHMDHVGIGRPNPAGDSIFNGADDDASGTAAVLEIAEAMATLSPRPRRSLLFLLVSGEEKGLWGSEWYVEHPTVPIERHVADLNLDMVGRNWPDTIVAIGKEHSDLGATLERVNREHPELGMTAIDDLWPDERFYFRSDHVNFARNGVPVLFFFNGTHDDYHGVDDEADRIDAEKEARIARLVFHLGLEVSQADEAPRWNPESYRSIVTRRR